MNSTNSSPSTKQIPPNSTPNVLSSFSLVVAARSLALGTLSSSPAVTQCLIQVFESTFTPRRHPLSLLTRYPDPQSGPDRTLHPHRSPRRVRLWLLYRPRPLCNRSPPLLLDQPFLLMGSAVEMGTPVLLSVRQAPAPRLTTSTTSACNSQGARVRNATIFSLLYS